MAGIMSRIVNCKKYAKELPGLAKPPFPGPLGQDIYENISMQAWQEWQVHQVRLINEKQLSMIKAEDRRFLQEQMKLFLNNEEFVQAEGYVPEKLSQS